MFDIINGAYSYQGRISYNPFVDMLGIRHSDALSIYAQNGTGVHKYATINAVAGTLLSVAVNFIMNIISKYFPAPTSIAISLLQAAAAAVGSNIVDGIIKKSIVKQYYVYNIPVSVLAKDEATGRQKVYAGENNRVALEGGGYSSKVYYKGYANWRTNNVAAWMFQGFWDYTYPGVRSYS